MKRFLKIFFATLLILSIQGTLNAQESFRIICKKEIQDKLERFLQINSLKIFQYSQDTLFNKLNQFFLDQGFLDFKITTEKIVENADTISVINISEGKKYLIHLINFNDSTSFIFESNKIASQFQNYIFSSTTIELIKWNVAELYELKGYPFAEIFFDGFEIHNENEDEKFLDLYFTVKQNEKALIKKIEIAGNNFTDENVIIRELRIKNDDYYNPQLNQKLIYRLQRLNIFSTIKKPEFYFDERDNGVLRVEVVETNTNSFDGIIGYVPSSRPNEKGYLTGQVNFSIRNLFGTLRAFSFRWNRIDRLSQDLEIKYFEPWLLGIPLNILPSFQQTKQDTTFIRRNFSSQFDFNFLDNFSILFSIELTRVIPQTNYFVTNIQKSSSSAYGFGIMIDTRDHPVYTKSGLFFRTDYFQVIKLIDGPTQTSRFNQRKGNLNFHIFLPLFKNQILFGSLNAKVIDGGKIEISDLYRLGGMNTLRGYEENQFLGSRIFWSNLEYRLFVNNTDYVTLFFDSGYYFRNILNEKISRIKIGYGFGMGFNMPLGLMKVNYALGEGDKILKGKIHFGIVSAF